MNQAAMTVVGSAGMFQNLKVVYVRYKINF